MSEWQGIFNRCANEGRDAARRGDAEAANPYPAETFGGKAWDLGWRVHRLPWWMRALGRMIGMVTR